MDWSNLLTVAGDKIKKMKSITSSSARLDSHISVSKGNGSVRDTVRARLWPEESGGGKIIATAIFACLISKDKG